jgi:hypothetical protein
MHIGGWHRKRQTGRQQQKQAEKLSDHDKNSRKQKNAEQQCDYIHGVGTGPLA